MPHAITVTEVGEYIRHQSCERRFKLAYNNREEAKKLPFANRLFNTIDPVLQQVGRKKEDEWDKSLEKGGLKKITTSANNILLADFFKELISEINKGSHRVYGREIEIEGIIGEFTLSGRIDFLIFELVEGQPKIRIVECKASRRDRTYHRIQLSIYKTLLSNYLNNSNIQVNGLKIEGKHIECVVARIDETNNQNQDILRLVDFNLDLEIEDIKYILGQNGPFVRVLNTSIGDLSFQLDQKCDGCVFNIHCLT